jgi:DNA polymerase III delta subunit
MLTVLVGNNTQARAKRLEVLLAQLKKNGVSIRTFSDIDFNAEEIRSLAGSVSLFGEQTAVVISGALGTADNRDVFEKIVVELAEAQNNFFVSEIALPAPFLKKVQTKGGEVEEFEEKKIKKAEAFNVFALTDAFSGRKRSMAWALYTQALSLGVESRELHGKIFWAVKTMLIAEQSSSSDSGLHAFVYGKAKTSAKNFEKNELAKMAVDLAEMFHQAYMSNQNLDTLLEVFILRSLQKKTV